MIIPVESVSPSPQREGQLCWSSLSADARRERLLTVAGEVFASRGLETPMSEVAGAAGAGVASIYRRYASKRELVAALVCRRVDQIAAAAADAEARAGSRFEALAEMVRFVVERQSADDFMGDARVLVADHPDVQRATERLTTAMERLLCAARHEGRLRKDATTLDLRLLFAATRAAKQVEPGQWPRMLELMLDALEARPADRDKEPGDQIGTPLSRPALH